MEGIQHLHGIKGTVQHHHDSRISNWQKLKYGMFIHWGLYSEIGGVWKGQPVKKGYSEQIQMWAAIPEDDYLNVAKQFTAQKFNPDEICRLAKTAGMKYILMTSKHHDGFCMFDTQTTDYNIVQQTPYGKDPLKLMSEACERHDLKLGIYFSLIDWHQGHAFRENNDNSISSSIENIIEEQLNELLNNYGPICEIWFDMSSPTEKQSRKLMQIVRDNQPQAMINSRIWNNMGDFRTLSDNEIPTVDLDGPWQTPASIYQETWGYRKWQIRENAAEKATDLLASLLGDGNYLLNIGPKGDGSVVPFESEVLKQMGNWLKRHPSLLTALPTRLTKPSWGMTKVVGQSLYLVLREIPANNKLVLKGLLSDVNVVVEDGRDNKIEWSKENDNLYIRLPASLQESMLPVLKIQLCGELEVLPADTHFLQSDESPLLITDIHKGYGYCETGNYDSMRQVIVRYTAYIVANHTTALYLKVNGTAAIEQRYLINVGDNSQLVDGYQLVNTNIGPFQINDGMVTDISIMLANPAHNGSPLNIDLESIGLLVSDTNVKIKN